jgi:hypothetical protein
LAGREFADFCAVYGLGGLGGRIDFDTYCQLYLNLDRVRLREAFTVARGGSVANTPGLIDRAYFDAEARTPEEADEMEFEAAKARKEHRLFGDW